MDATMTARGLPLSLWGIWWNAILLLRPAFSRLRTFMWFVTAVAGLTVRVELLGVTSIVRALNLRPGLYTKRLDHFHSSGVKLDRLSALWAQAVLQLFPGLVSVIIQQHLEIGLKQLLPALAQEREHRLLVRGELVQTTIQIVRLHERQVLAE